MDWLPYVRTLADAMGLRDWTFFISDTVADDHCDAQIRPIYGQRRAELRLSPDLDDYELEKQRGVLTHELLHCHLATIPAGMRHIETHLGPPVYGVFDSVMTNAEELAVDAIAVVLVPHLPLPEVVATVGTHG